MDIGKDNNESGDQAEDREYAELSKWFDELSCDGAYEVKEVGEGTGMAYASKADKPIDKKYQDWIDQKLSVADPFIQCAEWTKEMADRFPELKRVRGQVFLSNLWERDHWWLVVGEGEEQVVVDPTVSQFSQDYYGEGGGAKVLWYQERDESEPEPSGMCPNCGGLIYGGGDVCSDRCAVQYLAYVNSF